MRQPCAAAGVHAGDAAVPFWRGRLLRVNWHQQLNLLLDFWKNQRIFTTETARPSLSKVLLSGGFDFPQPFCSGGGRSSLGAGARAGPAALWGDEARGGGAGPARAHDRARRRAEPFRGRWGGAPLPSRSRRGYRASPSASAARGCAEVSF